MDPLANVDVNVPGVIAMLEAPTVTQLRELDAPELIAVGVAWNEVMVGLAALTVKFWETGVAAVQLPLPDWEA